MAARTRNGGIMGVEEVRCTLARRKGRGRFGSGGNGGDEGQGYSQEDIIASVGKMSKLSKPGSGFRTVEVGGGIMIVSVPTELDNDHMEVMGSAMRHGRGEVCVEDLSKDTGWDTERVKRSLNLLLAEGIAWLDVDKDSVERYWFPSVWKEGLTVSRVEKDDENM